MFKDNLFHIIPSVRDLRNLDKAIQAPEEFLLLTGVHIGNLKEMVAYCHKNGKKVIVNHELVGGLSSEKYAFELLKKMYKVDMVMGASAKNLAAIRKEGLTTVRRISLIDSLALDQTLASLQNTKSDIIELRPWYFAIEFLPKFKELYPCPYIAAGFISDKEAIVRIKQAGFKGIATSDPKLWMLNSNDLKK